jgi:tetratricopeptide (TPR) repeat protein
MNNVALTLNALGRHKEALALIESSLRIHIRTLGSTHPQTATDLSNRGEILATMNDFPGALKTYQDANAIWEREFGPMLPPVAYSLTGIGTTLVAMHRASEAIAPLERALDIRQKHDPDGARLGETEFALARALLAAHRDPSRSVLLAQAALKHYGQQTSSGAARSEIASWLSQRGKGSKRMTTVRVD